MLYLARNHSTLGSKLTEIQFYFKITEFVYKHEQRKTKAEK